MPILAHTLEMDIMGILLQVSTSFPTKIYGNGSVYVFMQIANFVWNYIMISINENSKRYISNKLTVHVEQFLFQITS